MFTVELYVCEDPYFAFNSGLVPEKHYCTYGFETDIFVYLNSHLLPTDVVSVRVEYDGKDSSAVIVYSLDEETILHMPPFHPISYHEIPF